MKKFLLCALLSAMTLLSGCAGMELYRGVDPSTNAFVSTGYPQAQIQPAEGFKNVSFGAAYVRVAEEDGMFTVVPVDASYALYYSDRSQLAVVVAECGPYCVSFPETESRMPRFASMCAAVPATPGCPSSLRLEAPGKGMSWWRAMSGAALTIRASSLWNTASLCPPQGKNSRGVRLS